MGWAATGVFTTSYFCQRAETMRRVQMSGAIVWVVYGVLCDAWPVVAANLLVVGAASIGEWRHFAARLPSTCPDP
jgi:hypothetical protein